MKMKMKKTLWLGLLVVAVLAMTIAPALAGGDKNRQHWRSGDRFALVGEVTEVNTAAQTIIVQVWMGSGLVKEYLGKELTITTTEETLFRRFDDDPHVFITFEDVAVEQYVSAGGNVVVADDEGNDLFLAERVTVDVPLEALAE